MANQETRKSSQFRPGSYFTGSVICRLRSELRVMRAEDLLHGGRRSAAPHLAELLDRLGVKRARRLVRSIDLGMLFEFERIATERGMALRNSLADYWEIDVAHRTEDLRQIAAAIQRMPEVGNAYLDIHVVPAAVNPSGNPLFGTQGYLLPAPRGIDAQWAWGQAGGDGSAVALADLEEGWNLDHEDLKDANPSLIAGVNRTPASPTPSDPAFSGWNHGTSALGIIAARDNTVGIVGIAPKVGSIQLASVWDGSTPGHVVNALTVAMASLSPGDIVMLELQTAHQGPGGWPNLYPIEVKDAERDAIRLAVSARNLVVVAAGGNKGDDLDNYISPQGTSAGKRVLNRNSADFEDSGSIMVAAASSSVPHRRMNDLFADNHSNFGSRMDCYGWGENVVTTGGTEPSPDSSTPPNKWYRQHFTGTSAATPIVAGAALLVQSINKTSTGVPLSGLQMRTLLSDPANGTSPAGGVGAKIGVMPDLRKLTTSLALTS
jgi:serine protease